VDSSDAHDRPESERSSGPAHQPLYDTWGPYAGSVRERVLWCSEHLERLERLLGDGTSTRIALRNEARLLLRDVRHLLDHCDKLERTITTCHAPAVIDDEFAGPCHLLRGHSGKCDPRSNESMVQDTARELRNLSRLADDARATFSDIAMAVESAHSQARQLDWSDQQRLIALSNRLHALSTRASSLSVDAKALTFAHLPPDRRVNLTEAPLSRPPTIGDRRLEPPSL